MKNKFIILLLICLIFIVSFGNGCKSKISSNLPESNLPEESFSTKPLTVKTSKDLTNYQKEFIKIRDFKDDGFPILNGFRCYKNIALISGGFEKKMKHQGTQAAIEYDSTIVYDVKSDKILRVIKCDEKDGFTSVFPFGINENWIVYYEDDDDEFNPNFRFYAINRKTGKTKLILERKRGHDEFFTKGENIPEGAGWWISPPRGILHGDKFYTEIYVSGSKVEKDTGTLPVISDSVYEIDLNTGSIKRIIHLTERYAGISAFTANDHYIAFSLTGRDFKEMTAYSDIYLYSFKDHKIKKFTDNRRSEIPMLTPDDWIIYQVWQPAELSLKPPKLSSHEKGCFYNVMRPINKKGPVFKIEAEGKYALYPTCTAVSPTGRFVLFVGPRRILDRKTNTIITLKGFPAFRLNQFPSDNLLLGVGFLPEKLVTRESRLWSWLYIVDINKLLQILGEE